MSDHTPEEMAKNFIQRHGVDVAGLARLELALLFRGLVNAERERCAKVAEEHDPLGSTAHAIRAHPQDRAERIVSGELAKEQE